MLNYRIVQRTVSIGGLFEMPELGPHWTVEFLLDKAGQVKPLGVFFTSRIEAECVGYDLCLKICQLWPTWLEARRDNANTRLVDFGG